MNPDIAKQKLGDLAGNAAEGASEFPVKTIENLRTEDPGLGMGVKDTGSSLATLARALADDGVRTDFHDMREDEKIPLKSRVKGAKVSHALRVANMQGGLVNDLTRTARRHDMHAT